MILSLCLFGGRLRDSLIVLYHLTTMWLSKLYQRSERDAVLLNIRNDFAELIMVDPVPNCELIPDNNKASSKLIKLEAPLKLINSRVELLKSKGYKEQDHIDLSLRDLAAV